MSQKNTIPEVIYYLATVLLIVLVAWNIYSGVFLHKIGIPGIIEIEFFKPESEDILGGTYLMDHRTNRLITVTHIDSNRYNVKEKGSWPWDGEIRLEGEKIAGHVEAINTEARMDLIGNRFQNGTLYVQYHFTNPGDLGRVDGHYWYPS